MARSSRPMRTHTHQEFEAELRNLKDRLLAMGGRCEQMIARPCARSKIATRPWRDEVMEADRSMDEDEVDRRRARSADLALRQPVGRDLRFAVAAVKASTDLERIGDEAVNIAERAMEMEPTDRLSPPGSRLPEMAQRAGAMLRDSLERPGRGRPDKARDVFTQDDAVDDIYGEVMQLCIDYMKRPLTHRRRHANLQLREVPRAHRGPRDQHRRDGDLHGRRPRRSPRHG